MLRTITEVSEIKTATNGNFYVVLTFASAIEEGICLEQKVRAFFGEKPLLKQVAIGMKMHVD